jgi:2-desacetyl-2-hydroxyethyl bacteriochlorophyllide A dehydrogenase
MKAVQLIAHGQPGQFELRQLPEPTPAAGEVVVEVHACGLNHLDLWLEQGELPLPLQLPRTPGCEIAGRVVAAAPDVQDWPSGENVAVQSNIFCGQCEYCRRGGESMCLQSIMLGVQRDGGFAEKVCVPARALVRLPSEVSFQMSAALTLAGSTAMHMLTNRAQVQPGDWVLVIGASSGVGSAAIQIAKQLGGRVMATASTPAKRALATNLGADAAIDSTIEAWPSEVRRITGKRGADLIVEHVGGPTLRKCLECLARGGTMVTCGATAGREATLDLWSLFVKQQRLVGSYSRNSADLKATLDWAAAGKLKPVIHAIYPLARTTEAFAALRARAVLGKVLVAPREA